MRFFPEELRPTLDRNYTSLDDATATKKRLRLANTNKLSRLEEFADDEDDENKMPNDDDLDNDDEDQGEADEEQQDDEYEEDEDDLDDDYNAEQYFSTGENDDIGDDDGGFGNDYD
jgi:DNA-directed RNA polymerase III subunit RPC7